MKYLTRLVHLSIASLLYASLVGSSLLGYAHAEPVNLLNNPSFESSTNATSPDSWFQDSWGTNNASFAYVTNAHTGAKAVQTTITTYQDGDAKWLFNALSVNAGSSYTYTDWYQATATTNLWAQFLMQDGSYQYRFLKTDAVASVWAQSSVDITVPAQVTKMSVFHVLATVGSLTLDDASLSADAVVPSCTTSSANGLMNGDFEDSCPAVNGVPTGWTGTQYGTAAGSYGPAAPYSGAQAVLVTNPTDGAEVGLTTTVKSPLTNQRYSLSFEQAGNTYTYAYVAFNLSNGSTQYQSLMSVSASGGAWSRYTDNFITPATVTSMQITLATSGAGNLRIDAVQLGLLANQTPATFTSGLVSLTFDDGDVTTYTNGFPALKTYGYKGTFYLNAGTLNTPGYMTNAQVKALSNNGQEIASHLLYHDNMVTLTDAQLRNELGGNITGLQAIVGSNSTIGNFASPYGAYTSGTIDTVMQYEQSHRTTDNQMNTKANFNVRQIHAYLVTPSTTQAQFQTLVTKAATEHDWLVLVYHNIATTTTQTGGEAGYTVTPTAFKKQLAAVSTSKLPVQTVSNALATLQAQL